MLAHVPMLLAPIVGQIVPEHEVTSGLTGSRIMFWLFAAFVLVGASITVTRRNNISAVMSLVGTFFGLAAMYALLQAHFLAALQVLVYAGAIMVLFIFVVMVLNRDESEPWAFHGVFSKLAIGVPALGYLVWRIASYFEDATRDESGFAGPTFGTVAEVGRVLFTDYLFAFESVSILLLIAVVAAVVVARTYKLDHAYDDAGPQVTTDADGHSSTDSHEAEHH